MVVFSDEVTKILHDSLCLFFISSLPILPCKRKTLYKKQKKKLPKDVMSKAFESVIESHIDYKNDVGRLDK